MRPHSILESDFLESDAKMKEKIYMVHSVVRLQVEDDYTPESAVTYVQNALEEGLEAGDVVEGVTVYELVDNGGKGL